MKKARLLTLLTITALSAIIMLSGCGGRNDVASISLKDHTAESVIETAVGTLDYNAYTLLVTYGSGDVEEVTLSEDMISPTDRVKLYQPGDHDLTVSYADHTYVLKVSVKRSEFGDISFPENNVYTYDGKAHTVQVEGDLPANAVVTYPVGNSFVNAGTYNVTATVSCEGYVSVKLSTTVRIERAKYDMSGVSFEPKEFTYDGHVHTVAISGKLPEGLSAPTYTINDKTGASATDVGEYVVKATFRNTDPNYEPIPTMQTTLKINPAQITVSGVDIVFKNSNGKQIKGATKVYDGTGVSFDINDHNKLSSKISVSYLVCDKDGNVISTSNKNTNIVNAGTYLAKVLFTVADGKNYLPIDPIVREFTVTKADYPISGISFVSGVCEYDGNEHSILIDGTLPADVTVSYEYYLNGMLVTDGSQAAAQSVVNAGRYTVMAVFTHTDPNRKAIPSISAILHMAQAIADTSVIAVSAEERVVYDGTAKAVIVDGTEKLPEGVEIALEYYLNGTLVTNPDGTPATSVTDVGEYKVKLIFNVTNANYAPIDSTEISFIIVEQG